MEEYKSNSNKTRDGALEPVSEKRLGPVVSGSTTTQKKSGFGKFAENIIAEDAKSVGSYLLTDVLLPAVKKSIDDIVSNGIHMLLYGKAAESRSSGISKISYNSYYSGRGLSEPVRAGSNSAFDYDNIIFENRGDAEAVLVHMQDILDQFGQVSVGELYDLADVAAPSYTVNKYGWTNLRNAQVLRCRDGYILKLPRAVMI